MGQEKLRKNWEYVKKNFQTLLNIYKNKYILVYNEMVVGSFDDAADAANEGISGYGMYSGFLIHIMTENEPLNIVVSAK